MASAPFDLGPVTGRVDREGRLIAADPALLRLQEEAGSKLGAALALPQLAAVARSAMKLGVPLSRSVIAASSDQDLDLWLRSEGHSRNPGATADLVTAALFAALRDGTIPLPMAAGPSGWPGA